MLRYMAKTLEFLQCKVSVASQLKQRRTGIDLASQSLVLAKGCRLDPKNASFSTAGISPTHSILPLH